LILISENSGRTRAGPRYSWRLQDLPESVYSYKENPGSTVFPGFVVEKKRSSDQKRNTRATPCRRASRRGDGVGSAYRKLQVVSTGSPVSHSSENAR